MRFHPKEPEEAVNYSRESLVREAAILLIGAGLAAAVLFFVLGAAVEYAAARIPARWEKEIFGSLSKAFEGDSQKTDAALDDVVRRISLRWPARNYEFRAAVVEQSAANAFALPGGGILVTRGLLMEAESENELAFVLAHELGHFAGRDHLRGMGRAAAFTLLSATVGAATGIGAPNVLGLAQHLAQSGFNREQESSADEFALGLVYAEYGHLAGAFDFFGRDRRGETESIGASWMSTHPSSGDRIERLETLARQRGWNLEGPKRPPVRLNQ